MVFVANLLCKLEAVWQTKPGPCVSNPQQANVPGGPAVWQRHVERHVRPRCFHLQPPGIQRASVLTWWAVPLAASIKVNRSRTWQSYVWKHPQLNEALCMKCLANRPNPINVSFFKIRHLHWRKPRNSNESSSCSQPGRPDCSHLIIPAYKKRGVLCCGSQDENTVGLNCNFILLPLYHSALTLKLVHHLGWTSCCF